MKPGKLLLFGAVALLGFTAQAQDDADRECKRMQFLAGKAIQAENYAEASMYYLKGETICGGYDDANWTRLIISLNNTINQQEDPEVKKAYIDTLIGAYDREEAAGFYDKENDLSRAVYILQSSAPDVNKADELFQRGIATEGVNTHESYLVYAYYNTYVVYTQSTGDAQSALKKRLIQDYFSYSKLASEAKMSAATQESLTTYLNYVVKTCDDILPEIDGYIAGLPAEKEARISALLNMVNLLEQKECGEAKEYEKLVDELVAADPNSFDVKMKKVKILIKNKEYRNAISVYKELMELPEGADRKDELKYGIAYANFRSGSYTSAYKTAMSVGGEFKGKGLKLAGQSVAQNANNCGTSTFERKCNYLYAVQLLQQASANGESTGGLISSYKAKAPTSEDCFNEGSPSSVSLTCYGVSVSPCN